MGFLVLSYLVSICWWAMCLWLGLLLMGGSGRGAWRRRAEKRKGGSWGAGGSLRVMGFKGGAMCLWLGLLLMGGSWVAHGWVQHGPWLQACAEAGAGLGRCAVKASATPCAYGLVVVGS